MKPGGSKAKGSDYERDVCKRLSLWMSRGMRTDLFWRSAMSGGRATVAHKFGRSVAQGGDITAVDTHGAALTQNVLIECKHYKEIRLSSMLVSGNHGSLSEWWLQAQRDAYRQARFPMLIAKAQRNEFVVLNDDGIAMFNIAWGDLAAIFPAHGAKLIFFSRFLLVAQRPR